MNKRQKSKRNMFNVLLAILDKYIAIFAKAPVLLQAIESFRAVLSKIDSLHPQQEADTTGIKTDRDEIREDLSEFGLAMAGIIYSFANDTGNNELLNQFDLSGRDFQNASLPNFKKLIRQTGEKCHELSEKLTPYGLTAEMLTQFDTLEQEYLSYETKPREATVGKTALTSGLATLFAEALNILRNKIDKLVLQFKNSNPEFYTEYINARNEIENPHHKTKAEKEAEKAAASQTTK